MRVARSLFSFSLAAVLLLACLAAHGATPRSKTIRVDHGRPVVVVSEKSVLVLEFLQQPIQEALIPHPEQDIRHCRAQYRFKAFDGSSGAITNGSGTVEEIYQRLDGNNVRDVGSRVGISAGGFYLWWSEGGAGSRSWVYYRSDSPVRFIQQPREVAYNSIAQEELRRYLAAKNVQEYSAAGKSIHVIGPAIFENDLPTEAGVPGRITSATVRDAEFTLKLTDLATNKHYIIESSYQAASGNWAPVHTILPQEPDYAWSEPLAKGVDTIFYRIRVAPY